MKIFNHGMPSVATIPSTVCAILVLTTFKIYLFFLIPIQLAFYQQNGVMSSLKKCLISFIAKVFPLAVYKIILSFTSQIFAKWRKSNWHFTA